MFFGSLLMYVWRIDLIPNVFSTTVSSQLATAEILKYNSGDWDFREIYYAYYSLNADPPHTPLTWTSVIKKVHATDNIDPLTSQKRHLWRLVRRGEPTSIRNGTRLEEEEATLLAEQIVEMRSKDSAGIFIWLCKLSVLTYLCLHCSAGEAIAYQNTQRCKSSQKVNRWLGEHIFVHFGLF